MILGYFNETQLCHSSFVNVRTGKVKPIFFTNGDSIFETRCNVQRRIYLRFGDNSLAVFVYGQNKLHMGFVKAC